MAKIKVLVEVASTQQQAFSFHSFAQSSVEESSRQAESVAAELSGFGLEVIGDYPPVPLFSREVVRGSSRTSGFAAFASPFPNEDLPASTTVISALIDRSASARLASRPGVRVWPDSALTLYQPPVDCRPFQPAVAAYQIRSLLGVREIWQMGFRGQGIVVGIIDEGVNAFYPVVGGFSRPGGLAPGAAPITSHGSMCAADVMVSAPGATILDYPFLGVPDSGGALGMFQAVLEQRRLNGTPHITNNSYGFVGIPPRETDPNNEVWDLDHPLHRKIREVITSGAAAVFAAGNCGADCPSGNCQPSAIGPGRSISGANSLQEVITVGAVNSLNQRIGYSAQGPGMFFAQKPDICAYSHFFGNFGPGRPGGSAVPFDNGTSAASPVAVGVAALLLNVRNSLTPAQLKQALIASCADIGLPGWDADTGFGVINAAAAYAHISQGENQ